MPLVPVLLRRVDIEVRSESPSVFDAFPHERRPDAPSAKRFGHEQRVDEEGRGLARRPDEALEPEDADGRALLLGQERRRTVGGIQKTGAGLLLGKSRPFPP